MVSDELSLRWTRSIISWMVLGCAPVVETTETRQETWTSQGTLYVKNALVTSATPTETDVFIGAKIRHGRNRTISPGFGLCPTTFGIKLLPEVSTDFPARV